MSRSLNVKRVIPMEDIWCQCEDPTPVPYAYGDGSHGFECADCGKLLQTG